MCCLSAGAYSGSDMDWPTLQSLMDDVRARRVIFGPTAGLGN